MDDFLDKAMQLYYIFNEEDKETIKNNFINSFFTDKNIKNLVFLHIEDGFNSCGIFRYNDEILYYDIDCEMWYSIYYEILNYNNKDTCELVKLMKKSSKNIEYILHPFFTKNNFNPFNLNPEYIVDISNSKELVCKETIDDCGYSKIVIDWKDGLQIHIDSSNNTYIVKKDGKFISGFVDDSTHFQLGDSYTTATLLNNSDIIIYNYGDVSSAVIIKIV